ncbi:hypothetical protein G7Y41_07100 [Schaalia sp. ZJ405]|uniref:hypothetical protein n=1 Tax=Schaalia sp. ZJ405 TaxID=2709403 RepID=UPI0013EC8D57|nr:hypothetical protein [Schaalia sp. ZJ405]QPK80820.1 hypothetical protein G7Y41_07100 [Schaalia sp. ZJ405]
MTTTPSKIQITVRGVDLKINANVWDDYEIIELLGGAEKNITALADVLEKVYGAAQLKKIKAKIKEDMGYVSSSEISKFLGETMQAAAPN